jgi:hypothetical protein
MRFAFSFASLLLTIYSAAQSVSGYQSLDKKQPIVFGGKYIVFKGDTIVLGPKAFFIDGSLTDAQAAAYPFVFNSVNKAAIQLSNGTEAEPMMLYLAPYVYWIDNPDDTVVRVPKEGATPYGLVIACEWLKFKGLTDQAENVVMACNRGQTIGAQGNFTMFRFIGQGTGSENLTFGNYCNVDLVYPLKPELSRLKRASAIVQAQLIHCNGDKVVARNTRFISRLNLCPFVGGKRVLFDRCHFESTDDALCGTGVYLNSTLDFYSSKPFYQTTGTGAVFLNCAIRSFAGPEQFFTKAPGAVAVVDSRFTSATSGYWGWQDVVPAETRNYQLNVSLNNKPLFIGKANPASTVDMTGKNIGDAYRFMYGGNTVYNTYNLLRGDDDWDPMNSKALVMAAEKETGKNYSSLPVHLSITPTRIAIETRKNSVLLSAKTLRFGNYLFTGEKVSWSVALKDKAFVQLKSSDDGSSCIVIPLNNTDSTRQVVVMATTALGLEAASVVTVAPAILEAPSFRNNPSLKSNANGMLQVMYSLDAGYKDQSEITWYRCSDAKGTNPIEVGVSRNHVPLTRYCLSAGDIGYYLMASVAPKHIRSKLGEANSVVMKNPVKPADIKSPSNMLVTDFKNLSVKNQPKVMPGFFTFEHFNAKEADSRNNVNKDRDAWYYGDGMDGAAGMQGLLQGRSAVMRYTPEGEKYSDMKLTVTVAPFKTAGQGFSVAHLYMDVLIKMDTKTMTGYALRFIRTTKYHDAVDCILMKYDGGEAIAISEPLSTTAFRTPCTITVEVKGIKLLASASTTQKIENRPGLVKEVKFEKNIATNAFGGFGVVYNGGSPTMINRLKVEWK